jgi:hypothetical protein
MDTLLQCRKCGFIAKTNRGLKQHRAGHKEDTSKAIQTDSDCTKAVEQNNAGTDIEESEGVEERDRGEKERNKENEVLT